MPSNDDIENHIEGTTKDHATDDAAFEPVLSVDHSVDNDLTSANEASAVPLSSDDSMPQEFTFFQKKKSTDQAVLASSVAYASPEHVTAFSARLDSAAAVNVRTQRHIAELMTLMSDVARTVTVDLSKPTCKRLRWSKWLFYVCLAGFGVGWFLLFPSGHKVVSQLVTFLAR